MAGLQGHPRRAVVKISWDTAPRTYLSRVAGGLNSTFQILRPTHLRQARLQFSQLQTFSRVSLPISNYRPARTTGRQPASPLRTEDDVGACAMNHVGSVLWVLSLWDMGKRFSHSHFPTPKGKNYVLSTVL